MGKRHERAFHLSGMPPVASRFYTVFGIFGAPDKLK
jgi:hypothetical protein